MEPTVQQQLSSLIATNQWDAVKPLLQTYLTQRVTTMSNAEALTHLLQFRMSLKLHIQQWYRDVLKSVITSLKELKRDEQKFDDAVAIAKLRASLQQRTQNN